MNKSIEVSIIPTLMIYSKNRVHFVKIIDWAYKGFAITTKGIFRVKFVGYNGNLEIFWCDVILPRSI